MALLKASARSVSGMGFLAALLFGAAGTLMWPQGWVFIALFSACSIAIGVWLGQIDPALLAERMKSPLSANQRLCDRMLMALLMVAFWGWFVFMALDAQRFRWSRTPPWAQALGALLLLTSFYGWALVLRANRFAATEVRVQSERGHRVASSGPYAIVRHPMYAYALPMLVGTPLLLGSLWGLIGIILLVPLLAARALGEEALLMRELPGYREYAAKVRFRLLPLVW